MRPVYWDSGVRFGDKNLRWGSPFSYLLEPGDAGYSPPDVPDDALPKTKHTKTMSTNATPQNPKVLRARCHDLADGLHEKEAEIGILQNTEVKVRADLHKIEGDPAAAAGSDARKGSFALYETCKQLTAAAEHNIVVVSDGAIYDFLVTAQGCLEVLYGKRFNPDWAAAGWPNGTTKIPRTHDQRLTLCASLRAYLAAHSTHERPAPPPYISFTEAEALARHTLLSNARAAANTAAGNQEACRLVMVADERALAKRFSGTVGECTQLLSPASPLWESLGLNIPANPTPPLSVTGCTATQAGIAKLLVQWPHARRAEAYRVMMKIIGVDTEPQQMERVEALEFTLKNLPAGATLEITIISTNAGGDAAASPVTTVVMPV